MTEGDTSPPTDWLAALSQLETGDILAPDRLSAVYELFPETGMTGHAVGPSGGLALLAAVPKEQISLFEEGDWRAGHRIEPPWELVFVLQVGADQPIECPFAFDLAIPAERVAALRLTEAREVAFYGVTPVEEGLMVTLKGVVTLPDAFRIEWSDCFADLGLPAESPSSERRSP